MMEWVTVAALIVGPVSAVLITRCMDSRRARNERKFEIFRNLMRTRGGGLSADHVFALNLIEVEFNRDTEIVGAWKVYREALQPAHNDNLELRSRRLVNLLQAIAKNLKVPMEQLDIMDNHYTPQGWIDTEERRLFIEEEVVKILSQEKALRIRTD